MTIGCYLFWSLLSIARTDAPASPSATNHPTPSATPATAGLYAWVDPESGKLRTSPPAGEAPLWIADDVERATSSSHVGLSERFLPSGGVALDLQGRFHHGLYATIDADGTVRYTHDAAA